ncbi:L,D-transpeptidase family protein [Pedobacter lithocola]|uniref:L,D-transpeptidase family protein n=1 Tax=Pedobacter lithocola TaxID=1908239 RepID=A0ABV8PBE0_9SPHI
MKTFAVFLIPIIIIGVLLNYKKEPEIADLLQSRLNNKIYRQFNKLTFDSVFTSQLEDLSKADVNISKLKAYYNINGTQPTLVIKFFADNSLDSLVKYLNKSTEHGINPKIFHVKEVSELIDKLKVNQFKSVDETYPLLARLEILSAHALTRYTSYLKFGLVNPKDIFLRYYIKIKREDSLFVQGILNSEVIIDTLRSVQNISSQYKALQQAYLKTESDSTKKILMVNMERLRWQLPLNSDKFIQVNIPDFRLVYLDGNDTLTTMKVCVGGRRDLDFDKKLKIYEKTGDIEDKPENLETPLLVSNIQKLYTNPVWNIPESIVQTEIYTMARRNSSYLKRKNIAVYHKTKQIKNPASIRWYKYDRKKIPFLFVQQPGSDNSLGRLKFIFPNSNSVYLHDTNFKQGFKLKNRAISHGCIRLEHPLNLAKLLVGDTLKYDEIRKELKLKPLYTKVDKSLPAKNIDDKKELLPALFKPKAETPLIITYITAWAQNDRIEYRSDVYGMDEKLWLAMKKFR